MCHNTLRHTPCLGSNPSPPSSATGCMPVAYPCKASSGYGKASRDPRPTHYQTTTSRRSAPEGIRRRLSILPASHPERDDDIRAARLWPMCPCVTPPARRHRGNAHRHDADHCPGPGWGANLHRGSREARQFTATQRSRRAGLKRHRGPGQTSRAATPGAGRHRSEEKHS